MNERMIELMNEANKTAGFTFSMDQAKPVHELMEKFAELIVRECSMIAQEVAIKYQDREETYSAGKKAGAFEVARTVKQHFGVDQ